MTYLVQQWIPPHWHDLASFRSREDAEAFASDLDTKTRIVEVGRRSPSGATKGST